MTPPDPMGYHLPELPSEVGAFEAAMWCAATLLRAATERGWPAEQLRLLMAMTFAGQVGDATDAEMHDVLQQAIDASRAHLAGKQ